MLVLLFFALSVKICSDRGSLSGVSYGKWAKLITNIEKKKNKETILLQFYQSVDGAVAD